MSEETTQQSEPRTENKKFDEFMEHQRRAWEEAGKAVDSLLPPDFKTHGKAAIEETIEAFRVLVNGVLDELRQEVNQSDADASGTTGKNKVKVEVSDG